MPGSAAGVVVVAVKCCREAPGQRLCAALEGCGRHNAPGTVTGRELGRAGEPRTDQLQTARERCTPCFLGPFMAVARGSVVLGQ